MLNQPSLRRCGSQVRPWLTRDYLVGLISAQQTHRSDWLPIYKLTDEVMALTLVRTGTHGDLFDE